MKYKYIPLILFISSATWVSCSKSQKKNTALPPTPVNVQAVEKTDATYYDQFPGTVVALNSVELRSQVTGFITGIYFKEGEVVPKGKVLYEIDRRLYEATYQQAKANLASSQASLVRAQKDADRYTQLLKQDAVARQIVDNAIATLETSRSQVAASAAAVKSAQANLSYAIIKAPFTGRIGISQVRLGAQVTPGSTLLNTISSENPIAVDFVVDESNIDRFVKLQNKALKQDSTFKLQLSDGQAYNHPGKIAVIDRGVNNQTGTMRVRIRFPNPQNELVDGMSCVLNVLNTASGNQLVIPYKAVVEQMGEFFVFVAQDTIAKQHKIKIGPKVKSNVVVLGGIKEGDQIITEGLQKLRDGGHITLGAPKQAPQSQQQAGK
ncbi:efflux RND transporter periplasmic adaptor subunit [Mucilaginibacter arboris]|uniref:Efflux RND transporter periplasmic adaptor subunit n=1 Tax=Mucilaginibacter arboris TaxID=2682090 RepID=A0A7K1T0Q0_9SPHI|nr:efflux RND transporter periplasmic adaptor subunit [Mucilaginibacter arboris]MVN23108.1 efflux RND transporter periplasmic adaptor subunit [Mucilaginibacter arboris]